MYHAQINCVEMLRMRLFTSESPCCNHRTLPGQLKGLGNSPGFLFTIVLAIVFWTVKDFPCKKLVNLLCSQEGNDARFAVSHPNSTRLY